MEIAEPEDSLIFFTGEGDRREEGRVNKSQVSAERLAQMFGVSYDSKNVIVWFDRPGACTPEKDCCR